LLDIDIQKNDGHYFIAIKKGDEPGLRLDISAALIDSYINKESKAFKHFPDEVRKSRILKYVYKELIAIEYISNRIPDEVMSSDTYQIELKDNSDPFTNYFNKYQN
jgi:hypothetical protein